MTWTSHLKQIATSAVLLLLIVSFTACSKKRVAQAPTDGTTSSGEDTGMADTGTGDSMDGCTTTTVYFEYDQSVLTSAAREALKTVAQCLQQNPNTRIQIQGHCDERGTYEYNLALGERRATTVKKYLSKLGVTNSQLETISYGEERPAVTGADEGAWSQNRRAEFVTTDR